MPGALGDKGHFEEYYEYPMKMAQKKDANETVLGKVGPWHCLVACTSVTLMTGL